LKPTKLVKGQGVAQLMADENCKMLDINCMGTNSEDGQTEEATVGHDWLLIENLASYEWYGKIAHLRSFQVLVQAKLGLLSSEQPSIVFMKACSIGGIHLESF